MEASDDSSKPSFDKDKVIDKVGTVSSMASVPGASEDALVPATAYKLYKRRWLGIIGLFLLNLVSGMLWSWFGPISNNTARDFNITLNQVNWLGNAVACVFLPFSLLVPILCVRYGIRRTCFFGAVMLLISAWIRYAGTLHSLSKEGAYALLMLGQLIGGISQPTFLVLGPKFSETWFDLNGRTTATMIVAISNPIGSGIGQLLSPTVGDTRQSILVLGIICTAVTPAVFLVGSAPPYPPTYAGSKRPPTFSSLFRALMGKEKGTEQEMSLRERLDFGLLTLVFGLMVGGTNSFGLLSDEILEPYGYSSDTAGFMGATLLLTGIAAAVVTSPLFDRVFTHHLAITVKILLPMLGAGWLSLIWAVKPHNTGGLYAIMTVIGMISLTILPVGLELGCEVTRNSDGSSSILWFAGNAFGIMFVLAEGALRAGTDANPPQNMRVSMIFNGIILMVAGCLIWLLRGRQVRRELDEQKKRIQEREMSAIAAPV